MTSSLSPFVAGAAAAYASVLLLRLVASRKSSSGNAESSVTRAPPEHRLQDSPDLDLRMIRKAEGAIRLRTSRLVIVIERCTNDHNYSAILRTAEALGVQHVYIIAPPRQKTVEGVATPEPAVGSGGAGVSGTDEGAEASGEEPSSATLYRSTGQVVRGAADSEARDRALHHLFAQKATEWIDVREFDDTASCVRELRRGGYEIWATDLSQEAVPLTAEDLAAAALRRTAPSSLSVSPDGPLPPKLAIAFGTEAVGCTAELLDEADMRVYLPLRGFADSLNLSVATALVVHHLFLLDPTIEGGMDEKERSGLRREWYAKLCRQRLLSAKAKKERARLRSKVHACEDLARKRERGETLNSDQLQKLEKSDVIRTNLEKMDRDLEEKSLRAVEDLVRNPPDPITDMRRADEHRQTFVGKKTKSKYGEAWANMPATANPNTPSIGDKGSTARYFRSRVGNFSGGNDDEPRASGA